MVLTISGPSTATKYGWSQPFKIYKTVTLNAGNNNKNSGVWRPQGRFDARGIVYIQFSGDPGIISGVCKLQHRMRQTGGYGDVKTFGGTQINLDFSTMVGPNWNAAFVGIPLMPFLMRMRFNNFNIANTVTVEGWIVT